MNEAEKTPLTIEIAQKDKLREIVSADNRHILWDPEKKEWFWPGDESSLPDPLHAYLYPGKGLILDHVLSATTEDYQKLKTAPPTGGRLRWEESLHRAVWRGRSLATELLPFQAQPESQEELESLLLNRIPQPPKTQKKQWKVTDTAEDWGDTLLIGTGPTLPGDLLQIPFEACQWLIPWKEEKKLKKPFQHRLPKLRIQGIPPFLPTKKESLDLLQVIRNSTQTQIVLPPTGNPLHTLHCLPEWEKKYRRKMTPEDFPRVLQAFQIQFQKVRFSLIWTPSPNDQKYFNTLLQ